jgi:sugar phosphate permease
MIVAGAFMIAFGSTTSAALGIAFQAIVGLFAGADYSAGLKLIAQWFRPSGRGFAMGVFTTATSLGTVIANATVPSLIEAYDWHLSYHLFGGISVVAGIVCWIFIRSAPQVEGGTARTAAALPNPALLFRNRSLLFLGLAGFCGLWGTYGFITWSNTLMIKGNGIDPKTAGLIVVIFGAVAIVVKPLVGAITDAFGIRRRTGIMVIFAGFVGTLLIFGTLSTPAAFMIAAPFLGIFAYVYSPLTAALTPTLAGERLTGSAAGATNAVWQLGSVIVPVVVGGVFASTHSFYAAFLTLAAGPLLGIFCMLGVREARPTRRRGASEPVSA